MRRSTPGGPRIDTQTALILAAAVAVLAVTALVVVLVTVRRKRTVHLKQRFGPEYDHAVAAQGARARRRPASRRGRSASRS